MDEARYFELLVAIHQGLPRQGPGTGASTRKALSQLGPLPENAAILDLGCGSGAQTLDLVAATSPKVKITAVDIHMVFLEELLRKSTVLGLSSRLTVGQGDMANLNIPEASFDVIWSEGAIYLMGFQQGLEYWKRFLKPGGMVAVTEATWFTDSPPQPAQEFWAKGYPAMQDEAANIRDMEAAGYEYVGGFRLPETAWRDEYYGPLRTRMPRLREKFADDPDALAVLDETQAEMDMYEAHGDSYGYAFFLGRLRGE
ncbi:MAG: class I SAM-dependent methyltransferase [Desulfovibrio sp.]|nr:MAG: class I SAM-dependent methyltransferase [Desulfovibrio sp.]